MLVVEWQLTNVRNAPGYPITSTVVVGRVLIWGIMPLFGAIYWVVYKCFIWAFVQCLIRTKLSWEWECFFVVLADRRCSRQDQLSEQCSLSFENSWTLVLWSFSNTLLQSTGRHCCKRFSLPNARIILWLIRADILIIDIFFPSGCTSCFFLSNHGFQLQPIWRRVCEDELYVRI